jgi:hypothetical protein
MTTDILALGEAAHPEIWGTLSPAQRDALILVAAVHEGRDRDTWGGLRYWDQLTERVVLSRIAGPDLESWWTKIATDMGVVLWSSNRAAVAAVIQSDNRAVLTELTDNAAFLIGALLRLCVDAARASRPDRADPPDRPDPSTPPAPAHVQETML